MEYKIIANPTAGKGRAITLVEQVESMLRTRAVKFDTVLTKAPGGATDLARSASAEGWPVIVGDGRACAISSFEK